MSGAEESFTQVDIDLVHGRFTIRAAHGDMDSIFDRIEGILERFWRPAGANAEATDGARADNSPLKSVISEVIAQTSEVRSNLDDAPKLKRSVGPRSNNYRATNLGLTDDQRSEIRKFFEEKKPRVQEEEIAVLATKVKQIAGKDEFTADDIFTCFRVVDRPTPKDLVRVFSNMKEKGRADRRDGKLIVTYLTEDFVNHHMVKSAEKKQKSRK